MKVILDFPNLKDSPGNSKQLQAMAELAKEAKGFCFYVDKGKYSGLQICHLNTISLASMIGKIEEDHPEIRQIIKISEMMSGNFSARRR